MECGECTVCCTMSVVPELNKGAGEDCKHCDKGCKIYGDHPQSCKDFDCAWLQHSREFSTPENRSEYMKLRPDKCGIMFVKKNDKIFCGIVMSGQEITDTAKRQIESFRKQEYSVVMLKIGERPLVLPSSGRDKIEVLKEYLETLRYGNV